MTNNANFERENFWKILFHLEELKSPTSLTKFLERNDIKKEDFFVFIEQSYIFGIMLQLKDTNEEQIISPLAWHREFGDIFLEKNEFKEMAHTIGECVEDSRVCKLQFMDCSEMEVFPWRIVFFENSLSLIAEDLSTKRLLTIDLSEIVTIKRGTKDYQSLFSRLEIEDFINAMRLVSGSEERLILKVQYGQEINLPGDMIYFGNPYTTMNQYGDLIWAASVEESAYLYEWLYSMRDKVEILDPSSIKNGFEKFCNRREVA